MDKKDITREQLKENIMKNIIFKIDYQGITDADAVVESFKSWAKGKFRSYEITFQNRIDLQVNNIEEVSRTLSIPIREISQQEIHRFSDNTFGQDELSLDISKYFSVLNIKCNSYNNINEYLEFFSSFTDFLFTENEYLSIKRIGLRKIGGKIFFSKEDIHTDFEKDYFNFDFIGTEYKSSKSRYADVLEYDNENPVINYIRSFEMGMYLDKQTQESRPAFQVTLDIDGYFSEELLKKNDFGPGKIKHLLENTNHIHLFNIFKMSVTNDFLIRNSK